METMVKDKKQAVVKPNEAWAKLPLFDRSKWKTVRFDDVVRVLKEQVDPESGEVERYVAGEHMDSSDVHIRRWGTVGDGYLGPAFIRRFRKGQVLYGSRRTYLKKVSVADFDGVTANTTLVMEAKEGLLQELLPWIMLSDKFTEHSVRESKGSVNPYINWSDIAWFEFALPPLDQQRRIAELLWALDEVEQSQISIASNLRSSLSAFVHNSLSQADAQQIKIRDFGKVITGSTPSTSTESFYTPQEFMFVSPADIGDGLYVDHTEKWVSAEGLSVGRPIPRNAVMVVCIGSTIGKVAMASEQCMTNQQINTIVCSDAFDPFAVYQVMLFNQNRFKQDAACTAVPLLNKRAFENIVVRYPSERTLPHFTDRLHAFELSLTEAENCCAATSDMKAALINSLI